MTNLKKKLLTTASFAAVAAVAVGGTLALTTFQVDDESKMNVLTSGEAVDIVINESQRNDDASALEDFEQGKKLYPLVGSAQESDTNKFDTWGMPTAKNYVDKIVTIENTGKADAYIRAFVAIPTELIDFKSDGSGNASDDALHWNYGNRVDMDGGYTKEQGDQWKQTWGWKYNVSEFDAVIDGKNYVVTEFRLTDPLKAGTESTALMSGLYLDPKVDYDNGVYTIGSNIINYDLSEGVDIPIYVDAVAAEGMTYDTAFADRPAEETFLKWADSVTGSVIAAPESGAVRPAGYAPAEGGEAIEGLVVIDESDADTNLRALYKNGLTGSVSVSNSYLDGTYAMNLTVSKDVTDAVLAVSNTDLRGWVSYSGFASAKFTNCTFDWNSEKTYNVIRPYDDTVFTNCEFTGTEFWLDMLNGSTITLVNCTLNGVEITDASQLTATQGMPEGSVVIG